MIFLGTLLNNDWLVLQAWKRKKTLVFTKGRDGTHPQEVQGKSKPKNT